MKANVLHITAAVLFILFAGSVSGSLDAMNWPSANATLLRNFGSNSGGRPVLGMIFGGGTDVFSAESGEVIFSRGKDNSASRLPSPLGAWTAVDHGDGLISIYSRYAENDAEDNPFEFTQVEKGQAIAVSGTSGWSEQEGFYFIIFDRRERRWINPAMIVTPVQETRPPQILTVELRNNQGTTAGQRSLEQGRYTVLVSTAGGAPLSIGNPVPPAAAAVYAQHAPQKIICSVNGVETGSLNFESVYARDGILMVSRNGLVSARQVYSSFPAFEAAEVYLNRGRVSLEIIVQDIAGNSRSVINNLTVN
ncbi:MAG: M23 family metallopeptidase [Treponema sp.]|nr:M23 family metallopeptidase [Treponema sp.]